MAEITSERLVSREAQLPAPLPRILLRGGREAERVELEAAQLQGHQGHRAAGDRLGAVSQIAEEADLPRPRARTTISARALRFWRTVGRLGDGWSPDLGGPPSGSNP